MKDVRILSHSAREEPLHLPTDEDWDAAYAAMDELSDERRKQDHLALSGLAHVMDMCETKETKRLSSDDLYDALTDEEPLPMTDWDAAYASYRGQ